MILNRSGDLEVEPTDPPWLVIEHLVSVRICRLVVHPPIGIVWHSDDDPYSPTRAERLARGATVPVPKGGHAGSYHIIVDRPGKVWQVAATTVGSWHGAPSTVNGLPANGASVGVCVVNPGRLKKGADGKWRAWPWKDAPGDRRVCDVADADLVARAGAHWLPYTPKQLEVCRLITSACAAAWGSCLSWTHGELDPERREDPGPLFPLAEMRALSLPAEKPTPMD